jgi:hypothetical protein
LLSPRPCRHFQPDAARHFFMMLMPLSRHAEKMPTMLMPLLIFRLPLRHAFRYYCRSFLPAFLFTFHFSHFIAPIFAFDAIFFAASSRRFSPSLALPPIFISQLRCRSFSAAAAFHFIIFAIFRHYYADCHYLRRFIAAEDYAYAITPFHFDIDIYCHILICAMARYAMPDIADITLPLFIFI